MKSFGTIIFTTLILGSLGSCSIKTSETENTFFELSPTSRIQTSDGVNLKEASLILKMYRMLSIGRVTLYYSELINSGQYWESKKKGHWGYSVMQNPILIDKKNGVLRHGSVSYRLKTLVKQYKENERKYQKMLQSHKT